ncbi:MAG: T9SS type A sorting domain-containing protein [Bacteroidales bacterium]|jgi:hypothetical protein
MKKITFIMLVLMLIGSMSFSQKKSVNLIKHSVISTKQVSLQKHLSTECDTLVPPTFGTTCYNDSITYYGITGEMGYVTGNDQYSDLEDAQKYYCANGGTISVVIVGEIAIQSGTPAANTFVNIYSVDPISQGPLTLLGTSDPIPVSAIDTVVTYTFSTPVTVTDSFFVSVVLPQATNDTVVVLSTPADCNNGDSLSWEMQSDGVTWFSFPNPGNFGSGFNPELIIYPVLCTTTVGVQDYSANNIISIYPNPSTDIINVTSDQNIETVKIINTIGQTVFESNIGSGYTQINTSEYKAGIYFIQVKNKVGIITKQLNVIK